MYIRTRLALLVTLLVVASLTAAGIATYKLLRIGLLAEVERDVERRAAAFALSHSSGPYYLDVFSWIEPGSRSRAQATSATACCL